jgi:hypothetical protein
VEIDEMHSYLFKKNFCWIWIAVYSEVIAKFPDCAIFSSADEQKSEQKITEKLI